MSITPKAQIDVQERPMFNLLSSSPKQALSQGNEASAMFERKQNLKLSLRIKATKNQTEATLLCRLSYSGERTGDYTLNMYIPFEAWDQKSQSIIEGHPLAEPFKARLVEIKCQHEQILQDLQLQGATEVTASIIRDIWYKKYIPAKVPKDVANRLILQKKQKLVREYDPKNPGRGVKAFSIQFHLRYGVEAHCTQVEIAKAARRPLGEVAHLQVRISVYGTRDSGFGLRLPELPLSSISSATYPVNNFGSMLTIDPKLWHTKRQELTGSCPEVLTFNNELQKIKLKIRETFSLQLGRYYQKTGPLPTTETVKSEYLTGNAPLTEKGKLEKLAGSLISGFDAYYQNLLSQQNTELALSEKSLEKRRMVRDNLVKFLDYEDTPDLKAKLVNQGWAKRFTSWLMQDGRMTPDSARQQIGIIRMVLSYLVEHDQLDANPLIGIKLPRGKKKQVVWLSPDQVESLWSLDANDIRTPGQISMEAATATLFWFKVIVLTGMDYVDAVRYVQNPKDYDCMGIGGRKIVIRRGKNGSECHIPYSDKLEELLLEPMPRVYSNEQINQTLTIIGELIGFPHALTTKVGRKTAGAMWLLEKYTIHEISRFLGHSSIAMTESHYVKTSGLIADRGMQRVKAEASQPKNSFRHTYLAS